MSNQTPLQLLAGQIRFKLDKKNAERLAELDRTFQLGMARIGDLNNSDLRNVWTSLQQKALDALKRAETVDQVAEIHEPSKQAIRAAAADARASLKNSLREISREANDLAMPEAQRFVIAATEHVDRMIQSEAELSAAFGIPHRSSPLIESLKHEIQNLASLSSRPWNGGINRPADFVKTFAPID
jgi:hypothetical protein